ncbi:uncharacterized protein LOC135080023 [Ostrinia nubilalis]|uniref:uncharacterized protein LOC135080023 n=1 Tax=Ostrinia nubilalis TaxID=29057 RepID=UPI0030822116
MVDTPSPFTCNIKDFIIDEIALEGLEGIGLDLLWRRLEQRISSPFLEKMQQRWWNFIVNCERISIYELPVPMQHIDIVDRLSIVHQQTGYLLDPDFYLDGEFEYNPAEDDYGSCTHYATRKLLSNEIRELPYKTIMSQYGDKLVLVASLEERWKALAPNLPMTYINLLPKINYCLLELIGRSRENGQMTTGKSNLTKIVKDSKILFYYRKTLQDLDLVRVTYITQVTGGRAVKGLLLRLRRFHKAIVLTVAKTGLIRDLVDYLKDRPNYCEPAENVIKKGLMTPLQSKRFQKKVNIFQFADKLVTIGESTNPKVKPKLHRRRYMCLVSKSDESSESEEEEVIPKKCQYKVGVNLMRQAYERFLDAGKHGLTQNDLAEILGVEFYVSRSLCRVFRKKNIVREFIEYKGKQRLGRYIAIAATSKMDNTLAEEQEKLKKYLEEGKSTTTKRSDSSDSEPLVHKKKRKLENNDAEQTDDITENIIEIKEIVDSSNRKHQPHTKQSLRHIRFASGILKVLNERTFVMGYQTLSNHVSKEINEPPMDTKAMKMFLQNMMNKGHIKVFKMKLPRIQNQYSILLCAPHVQKTDPIIRAKYKEILSRASFNRDLAEKKMTGDRPISQYAFPRFVKVQKLHESLMTIVYFNDIKSEDSNLPQGFFSMESLLPELTVGVALGHISSEGVIDIAKLTIDNSMYSLKISEAPKDVQRSLMNSSNLNSSLRCSLRILGTFGLVQFVADSFEATRIPDNNMTVNVFYLNKFAKIIDTSGVWPRKNDPYEAMEKEYHFDSFEVVQDFWTSVYNISLNTTIELQDRKKAIIIKTPTRSKEQVEQFDNGERHGDGLGPCGYDSSYYMDLQRLWKAYCIRSTTMKIKKMKRVHIPKLERTKKPRIVKRKTKKVQVKKSKPQVNIENVKPINIRRDKKRITEVTTWTFEEDRLLMMCKAALVILSPVSQPGSLQVRNLAAKDILTIDDPKKTLKTCHKRSAVIDSNSTLTHEKNWVLNEIRKHNKLLVRYEGLLKKLRTMYPTNMAKYISEARVPMMELVWIIYHLLKNMSQIQDIPCIAMSFEEFNRNFNIIPASANKRQNLYRTPHDEIVLSTLKEAMMLTVMLSFDSGLTKEDAATIYAYFGKFTELFLRTAIEPLRKCGAIAAKEKILNNQMHIVELNDITQCSYRISVNYQRKWASRLSSGFASSLVDCLNQNDSEDPIKPGSYTNCFCFELNSIGAIELVAITVPVITGPSGSIMQDEQLNVIDIETNFKLKSGKLGWKKKSDAPLGDKYKDIQIKDALEDLSRQSIIYEKDTSKILDKLESDIVMYVKQKGEKGTTFEGLQKSLNCDKNTLIKNITELEAKYIMKRVGFYENILVHTDFTEKWTMQIKDSSIIPIPWLTLESKIRSDIFLQWAGVVLNKVFENPGCSVSYLSENCELITARAVQDICEVLQKCACVTLNCLKLKEPSLFSDEDDVISEMSDYNQYESPKTIIVVPVNDCLTKFSYIRKMMSDT